MTNTVTQADVQADVDLLYEHLRQMIAAIEAGEGIWAVLECEKEEAS